MLSGYPASSFEYLQVWWTSISQTYSFATFVDSNKHFHSQQLSHLWGMVSTRPTQKTAKRRAPHQHKRPWTEAPYVLARVLLQGKCCIYQMAKLCDCQNNFGQMNSPFGSCAIYLHLIGCYWPTSAKVRWGWWTDEFYWIGSCQLENQWGWPGLGLVNHIWVARKSIGKQSSNHWGKSTRRAEAAEGLPQKNPAENRRKHSALSKTIYTCQFFDSYSNFLVFGLNFCFFQGFFGFWSKFWVFQCFCFRCISCLFVWYIF